MFQNKKAKLLIKQHQVPSCIFYLVFVENYFIFKCLKRRHQEQGLRRHECLEFTFVSD